MPRLIKRLSKKKGLPPGALVHIGEEKIQSITFGKIIYNQEQCKEEIPSTVDEFIQVSDKNKIHWLNINGLHDTKAIETIGNAFNLHPLVLEDILNTEQRPKIEDYGDYIFAVLKMLSFNESTKEIHSEQISLIVGNNYVISFQEKEGDVFNPLRDRLRKDKSKFRKSGSDYLFYALVDAIVDHYFLILENIGDHIQDVEESVSKSKDSSVVKSLYILKRELIILRKSVWPLREIVNSIQKSSFTLLKKTTLPYFRDVYDHTVQVIEAIEAYRDLSSSILDMHMTIVSNRMNEIMKILTIIATIFIPLTFIAGIYGMNFKFMPELEWKIGYPLVISAMAILALGMLIFFKKKNWF